MTKALKSSTSALAPIVEPKSKTDIDFACDEADEVMRESVKRIDAIFGEGYAKTNTALLGSYMETAMCALGDLRHEDEVDERATRLETMLENLKATFADAMAAEDPIATTRPKT